MAAELAPQINPATALITQEEFSKLHRNTLPTTGFLAHVIPGLDVDLEHLIGVWEGTTKVRGYSGREQQALLRIECGNRFSPSLVESSITIVTMADRRRERWVIEEFPDSVGFTQEMDVLGSVVSGTLAHELNLDQNHGDTPGISVSFDSDNPTERFERPSQLPLRLSEDVDSFNISGYNEQLEEYWRDVLLELKYLIQRADSGIAVPEIRSKLTQRIPIPLEHLGIHINNMSLVSNSTT